MEVSIFNCLPEKVTELPDRFYGMYRSKVITKELFDGLEVVCWFVVFFFWGGGGGGGGRLSEYFEHG